MNRPELRVIEGRSPAVGDRHAIVCTTHGIDHITRVVEVVGTQSAREAKGRQQRYPNVPSDFFEYTHVVAVDFCDGTEPWQFSIDARKEWDEDNRRWVMPCP